MEQAFARMGRRSGWSEAENQLLWETAEEAQQQGLPLKVVFERIAEQTGRRPHLHPARLPGAAHRPRRRPERARLPAEAIWRRSQSDATVSEQVSRCAQVPSGIRP